MFYAIQICSFLQHNRKVGSKLILNTPKINDKNQQIDLELSLGLTHHSTKWYPQIYFPKSHRLHKIFNRDSEG